MPTLKKLPANELNAICLTCHEKANQASFLSSMHARRNVACTTCHSVHDYKSEKAQLKTTTDTETCFTCHKSERAKSMRTSHHPVREGKMGCASCHNPHDGPRPKMLKADSVNELCYKCHTEKRGPFLYEHAPVREDCATCHDPHGSNHERLLVAKPPFLCQRCHYSGHGITGDHNNTLKGAPDRGAQSAWSGVTQTTRSSRQMERSCKNCHYHHPRLELGVGQVLCEVSHEAKHTSHRASRCWLPRHQRSRFAQTHRDRAGHELADRQGQRAAARPRRRRSSKFEEYREVPKGVSMPEFLFKGSQKDNDFSLFGKNVSQTDQRYTGFAKTELDGRVVRLQPDPAQHGQRRPFDRDRDGARACGA